MHEEVKSTALNPYQMAVQQFEEAAIKLNLSEDMREILRQPKRELIVNFTVRCKKKSMPSHIAQSKILINGALTNNSLE